MLKHWLAIPFKLFTSLKNSEGKTYVLYELNLSHTSLFDCPPRRKRVPREGAQHSRGRDVEESKYIEGTANSFAEGCRLTIVRSGPSQETHRVGVALIFPLIERKMVATYLRSTIYFMCRKVK